jgi:golgi SNAP receptor complex member 1
LDKRKRCERGASGLRPALFLRPASQAVASLAGQRAMFVDMSTKMGAVGAKFPVVNSLVTAIRRKKSKEAFILAAVVASCTLFTLVYWSYK